VLRSPQPLCTASAPTSRAGQMRQAAGRYVRAGRPPREPGSEPLHHAISNISTLSATASLARGAVGFATEATSAPGGWVHRNHPPRSWCALLRPCSGRLAANELPGTFGTAASTYTRWCAGRWSEPGWPRLRGVLSSTCSTNGAPRVGPTDLPISLASTNAVTSPWATQNGGSLRGCAKSEVTFRDGMAIAPSSARRVGGCRVTTWQARPRPWRACPARPCRRQKRTFGPSAAMH
jgi:hypothetical protein